jgi:cysteine synthase A
MVIGQTPVVRLQRVGAGRICLKLETFSPNATIADRLALALCDRSSGGTIREGGDGALCIALAAQCAMRKWPFECWLSEDASIETRQALQHLAAKLTLTPFEEGPSGAKKRARQAGPLLSEEFGSVRLEVGHAIGAEIVKTEERVDAFVCGIGTGATISAVMSTLKTKWPHAVGVAVQPASAPVIDQRIWKPHRQPGNAPSANVPMLDRTLVSRVIDVRDEEAWEMRARLGREEGLLLSIGSAAAVVGAEKIAVELEAEATVLALAADTGERDFSLAEQFK